MIFEFTAGLLLGLLVLTVVVAVPIKIGAHMASARRTGILWCWLAAILGVLVGQIAASILGSGIGGPLAAMIGFAIGVRIALGSTFFGAVGISIIAVVVSLLTMAVLAKLGILTPSETIPVSTS